jgi:pimeloyl-ACP methyl ester carboxylesterase
VSASPAAPLLVLIHGAWASSWVWDPVIPALEAHALDVATVVLPGSESPEAHSTIARNVETVLTAVGDHPGPVFLVGHSGGGITVSAAGEALAQRLAGRLAGAVYVAGIMLPSGVSFDELRARWSDAPENSGVAPYLEPALDGRGSTVPQRAAIDCLFQLAPADQAQAAAHLLQPQWYAGLDIVPTWTPDGFGRVRRLYIEAVHDRDIPLPLQRRMQQRSPGAEVVTLDSDHCPQLSAPEALVAAIVDFVGASGAPAAT